MLLHIPGVFTKDEVATLRGRLDAGPWADGNVTSGHQSATAKVNRQLPEDSAEAREVGALVLQALNANPMFVSAALPHTIFPPLFNRYEGGEHFAVHVDNAIRQRGQTRIRSDLSATLFLSEPDEYDGGELIIEEMYGPQTVKLPAGDLVLYPSRMRTACRNAFPQTCHKLNPPRDDSAHGPDTRRTQLPMSACRRRLSAEKTIASCGPTSPARQAPSGR